MKYRLTRPARPIDLPGRARPTALVWVESAGYDEDGVLRVEGDDPGLVELIREHLENSYGNRARIIELDCLTPRDLACALDGWQMRQFEAQEVPE